MSKSPRIRIPLCEREVFSTISWLPTPPHINQSPMINGNYPCLDNRTMSTGRLKCVLRWDMPSSMIRLPSLSIEFETKHCAVSHGWILSYVSTLSAANATNRSSAEIGGAPEFRRIHSFERSFQQDSIRSLSNEHEPCPSVGCALRPAFGESSITFSSTTLTAMFSYHPWIRIAPLSHRCRSIKTHRRSS